MFFKTRVTELRVKSPMSIRFQYIIVVGAKHCHCKVEGSNNHSYSEQRGSDVY